MLSVWRTLAFHSFQEFLDVVDSGIWREDSHSELSGGGKKALTSIISMFRVYLKKLPELVCA